MTLWVYAVLAVASRTEITEAVVHRLVHAFYARIREDAVLGPIFESRVAQRWPQHLATMVDFWSSVTLMSGRYGGKPHIAHQALDLTPAHFQRWLAIFEATAEDVCDPAAATFFMGRAHRIADSLQIGLNIGPKALQLPKNRNVALLPVE